MCCAHALSSFLAWLWAQPLPERAPSQRIVLQWLARGLQMQLFAVVCAAAEPRIGFPYAVALSYVVVWAVARSTLLSHGARCRLDTCLCFALVTFALAKTKAELRDTDANQSIAWGSCERSFGRRFAFWVPLVAAQAGLAGATLPRP